MLHPALVVPPADSFKERLLFRRKKLDDLAMKLSNRKDESSITDPTGWLLDMKKGDLWAVDRTPVQVYFLELDDSAWKNIEDIASDTLISVDSLQVISKSIVGDQDNNLSSEEKSLCSKLTP